MTLGHALERDELELHYQPVLDLRTGAITGLEALVRWRHPSRGLVPPSEFVPEAERTGEVVALGRWVLGRACRQAARWQADHAPLEIAVNLSSTHLGLPGLVDEVRDATRSARLDPASLLLEITETALIRDTEASMAALEGLRALGVRIALDDFGTGYSSLQYLDRYPLDALKIPKAFVDDVAAAPGAEPALVRAIVELAQVFELRVIAEGIERAEQPPALLELGCELGQGNLFSPPVPAERAGEVLFGAGHPGEAGRAASRPRAGGMS